MGSRAGPTRAPTACPTGRSSASRSRALAAEPRLLLLDEPAAGLNPSETREIDELIRRTAARGVTVVLVEHNMKLVMEVSQHVIVLDYGRKLPKASRAR